MKRYVMYDEAEGVYLGNCLGFGFWSKCDAVGQTHACTFDSPEDGKAHQASWDDTSDMRGKQLQFIPVDCVDGRWASMEECVAAGLPAWTP